MKIVETITKECGTVINTYNTNSDKEAEKILKEIHDKKMSWLYSKAGFKTLRLSDLVKNSTVLVPFNRGGKDYYPTKTASYHKAANFASGYTLKVEIIN